MSAAASEAPVVAPASPPAPKSAPAAPRQSVVVSALSLAALVTAVAAYFFPLWWVSLTAPNYPADAFPDGIRIFFSFTGVSNGCTTAPKASRLMKETQQEDLGWRTPEGTIDEQGGAKNDAILDCMNEMNTINHYVGMHPIGVGAPVERLVSKYLIAFLAVSLLGLALGAQKPRVVVLAVGYLATAAWLFVDLFARGGLKDHVATYISDAGKYFREPERIAHWGENLEHAVIAVSIGLVLVMVAMVVANLKWPRAQLLLGLGPALLPVFFVGAYAGWLYFFGHNLHPWGAFTVKPFMPTVFGDGKVAQFSTHSYPLPAFALVVATSLLSLAALARRRLEFPKEA
ncbi:MAG: hypothetical protein U0228_24160 [Myxococcaceae bacterium]